MKTMNSNSLKTGVKVTIHSYCAPSALFLNLCTAHNITSVFGAKATIRKLKFANGTQGLKVIVDGPADPTILITYCDRVEIDDECIDDVTIETVALGED
jgi:hypothetical protein